MLKELLLVSDLYDEALEHKEAAEKKIEQLRYVRDITKDAKQGFDIINQFRRIRESIKFGDEK